MKMMNIVNIIPNNTKRKIRRIKPYAVVFS